MTARAQINLVDPTLFGNNAAEDEQQDVFKSYFIDRSELTTFMSEDSKLLILNAYRGEGKSGLLRRAQEQLSARDVFAIRVSAASISPTGSHFDSDQLVRAWQRNIFHLIASEIGSRIGIAWTDDAMTLVEEAERNGFKSRSFISSIWDRIKYKHLPERASLSVQEPEKIVSRWSLGKSLIWVFIDDIDDNFQNNATCKDKIAAFFTACRYVVNNVPQIRLRTGIRPNVWRIISREAQALAKAKEYLLPLPWNYEQIRTVIAKRIEGYLIRNGMMALLTRFDGLDGDNREERIIALAFDDAMQWGYDQEKARPKYRRPSLVLNNLSRGRPRWLIELVKLAASIAHLEGTIITIEHLTRVLKQFGEDRIDDLATEYSSECPQVKEIINAFSHGSEDYTTDELTTAIRNRILEQVPVTFAGSGKATSAMPIAAFLYEIGFLTARERLPNNEYCHHTFAEKPDLLHGRTNIDHGFSWEIHPVFRQALGMRDTKGQKTFYQRSRKGR